jgi:hypothetical protein
MLLLDKSPADYGSLNARKATLIPRCPPFKSYKVLTSKSLELVSFNTEMVFYSSDSNYLYGWTFQVL